MRDAYSVVPANLGSKFFDYFLGARTIRCRTIRRRQFVARQFVAGLFVAWTIRCNDIFVAGQFVALFFQFAAMDQLNVAVIESQF